jgi:hypothetical protein
MTLYPDVRVPLCGAATMSPWRARGRPWNASGRRAAPSCRRQGSSTLWHLWPPTVRDRYWYDRRGARLNPRPQSACPSGTGLHGVTSTVNAAQCDCHDGRRLTTRGGKPRRRCWRRRVVQSNVRYLVRRVALRICVTRFHSDIKSIIVIQSARTAGKRRAQQTSGPTQISVREDV